MTLIRWAFILVTAFALSVPMGPSASAQSGSTRQARYEATAATAREGADTRVTIDILRWSTEEEIDEMISTLESGVDGVMAHLQDAPTLGYLWTAESVGYSIRYAARAEVEGAGARIILVLNDRFGTRNPTLWASDTEGDAPYTVIELRVDARGRGEGRNVLPTAMAYAFGIDGYELAQVLLSDVTLQN